MDQFTQTIINPSAEEVQKEQSRFITKVYGWMSLALFITALTSLYVASQKDILQAIFGNKLVFYGCLFAELGLVWYISSRIFSMSLNTGIFLFLLYSVLNGVTISFIFLMYTSESIALTFFVTAGMFAVMSIYGYTTQRDLTKFGGMLYMVLVGLILASIANWFMNNSTLYWITTYVGVFVFTGLVAYDTQKIKEMNIIGNEGTDEDKKEAIMGALSLYLDFINLFLYLLRILGGRRD